MLSYEEACDGDDAYLQVYTILISSMSSMCYLPNINLSGFQLLLEN